MISTLSKPPSRRWAALLVAGLTAVIGVGAGCGGDDDSDEGGGGKLVISSFGGTWEEAIELGFVQEFEQETGIEVEINSALADVAKSQLAIEKGNPPPEDIVDVGYSQTVTLADEDLLEELEIPESTLEELDPAVQEQYRDLPYGITWGQFAYGVCYDKRQFPDKGPQPSDWADFWNFSKFAGDRGYPIWDVGVAEPLPELGLLADGVAVEDLYPIDEERAFAKLDELRPHVPKFATATAELGQQLVDGSVSVALCFTHRINKLIDGGADFIGISYDQARLQGDQFVVWKDAPNKENAMQFLDFILQKEAQARWARIGYTVPVNPAAFDELPEDVAARIATSPENGETTFTKDESYYAEQQDGVTNFDRLIEDFTTWLQEG